MNLVWMLKSHVLSTVSQKKPKVLTGSNIHLVGYQGNKGFLRWLHFCHGLKKEVHVGLYGTVLRVLAWSKVFFFFATSKFSAEHIYLADFVQCYLTSGKEAVRYSSKTAGCFMAL